MKLDKLVGERFKEKPSDCVVESHALMMRGGYMKDVAKGIYSQFTPLKRICQKIEAIIREEMDAIDGQEVLFPVALPASCGMSPDVTKVSAVSFYVLPTATAQKWSQE